MHTNFTTQEKANIVSRYWNGEAVAALCSQYRVPRSTLYSWLKPYKNLTSSDTDQPSSVTQKEYADLKRHADKQEQVLDVIRLSSCTPASPLEDKLTAFWQLQGKFSARVLCEALDISRGTYHNRIIMCKEPTVYEQHHQEISAQVRVIFDESQQRYGADKILAVLAERNIHTSKKYILELMREMGLQSISVHAKKDHRAFAKKQNIVQRQFQAAAPDIVWVSDVTCIKVKENYLYICVILDLYSRKALSCRVSRRNSTQLITATFKVAFQERGCPTGLIFHSDRGAQYTANAFRRLLLDQGVTQSFSQPGRPVDNAVAEAFFSFMKREELYRRNYRSEKELRESVAAYIRFYNAERPHRNNGYRSPEQFEAAYHLAQ